MNKSITEIIAVLIINTFFSVTCVFAADMLSPALQINNRAFQDVNQKALTISNQTGMLDIDGLKIPIKIPSETDILTEKIKNWVESKQSKIMENTIARVELSSKQVIIENAWQSNNGLKRQKFFKETITSRVNNFLDFFMNQIKNKDFSDIDLRIIHDPDLTIVYPYPAFIDNKYCVIVPLLWLPDKNGGRASNEKIKEAYQTASKIILDVIYQTIKESDDDAGDFDKQLSPVMQSIVDSTIVSFDSLKRNLVIPDLLRYWSNIDIKLFIEDFLLPNLENIKFAEDFDIRFVKKPHRFGRNVILMKFNGRYTLLVPESLIPNSEILGTDQILQARNDAVSHSIIAIFRNMDQSVTELIACTREGQSEDNLVVPDEEFIQENTLGWVNTWNQQNKIINKTLDHLYPKLELKKEKVKSLSKFFEQCSLNMKDQTYKDLQIRIVVDSQRKKPYFMEFKGSRILVIPYNFYAAKIEFKHLIDQTFARIRLGTKEIIKENILKFRHKYEDREAGINNRIEDFALYFMNKNKRVKFSDIEIRFCDNFQKTLPYKVYIKGKPVVIVSLGWLNGYKQDADQPYLVNKDNKSCFKPIMKIINQIERDINPNVNAKQKIAKDVSENKVIVELNSMDKEIHIPNWLAFKKQNEGNSILGKYLMPFLLETYFYEDFEIRIVDDGNKTKIKSQQITFANEGDKFVVVIPTSLIANMDPKAEKNTLERRNWDFAIEFLSRTENFLRQNGIIFKPKRLLFKQQLEIVQRSI